MSPPIRIHAMPDGRAINPYQQLLADALRPLGAVVHHPNGYRRLLPLSRTILCGEKPDLLHLHWPSIYLRSQRHVPRALYCLRTLLDIAVVRACGVPVVWTLHNLVTHDSATPRLEMWFSRRLAASVDHVIAHSDGAKREAIDRLGVSPAKISVIPHGTYKSVYGAAIDRMAGRARLGIANCAQMALFFGTVRPYKGVSQLLKAWPSVHRRLEHAELHVSGHVFDPGYRNEIEQLAADIPSVFLDLRYVPDDEVAVLMAAADILVLPYNDSLTSGTIALANTYDVPVVTPRFEGTAAMRRGVFATSTEPDDLADAIVRALMEPKANRKPEVAEDDWTSIAILHRKIFEDCLGSRRRTAEVAESNS